MHLAVVAPLVAPLRPAQAGGTQALVADLARALTDAGDDVLLVAARGSRVPGVRTILVDAPFTGALHDFAAPAPPVCGAGSAWPSLQAAAFLRVAAALPGAGVDVVHAHALDWPAFYACAATGLPTVHTLHLGPVEASAREAAVAAASCRPRPLMVAVSESVAAAWRPLLRIDAVVPNGVDPASVPFSTRPRPDLAVVAGRISPEKGTHLAIRAARLAGMRVVVAGPVYDAAYHEETVRPLLDGDAVRWVGSLPRARLAALFGRAAVTVVASLWEEPFGLVPLESNLAGTPVAALARGALPEVVGPEGGVLVDRASVAALARAVREAAGLDRAAARRSAARRFPLTRMVARYRALYRRLTG